MTPGSDPRQFAQSPTGHFVVSMDGDRIRLQVRGREKGAHIHLTTDDALLLADALATRAVEMKEGQFLSDCGTLTPATWPQCLTLTEEMK